MATLENPAASYTAAISRLSSKPSKLMQIFRRSLKPQVILIPFWLSLRKQGL